MSLLKKNKLILTFLFVLGMIGFAFYTLTMEPPTSIENRKVYFTGSADELLVKITDHTEELQDKIVVVSGEVTNIDENGIMLSSKIYCQLCLLYTSPSPRD